MGKLEKAKERLKQIPRDYTYIEARNLLIALEFEEWNKGKTSGSRVQFYRKRDKAIIDLHKPHPQNEMKMYAIKQLMEKLTDYGDL
jgi:hypothetical protein